MKGLEKGPRYPQTVGGTTAERESGGTSRLGATKVPGQRDPSDFRGFLPKGEEEEERNEKGSGTRHVLGPGRPDVLRGGTRSRHGP